MTTNNELIVFDITTGSLIQQERNISLKKYEALKNKSDLYTITYSDNHPSIYNLTTNQNQDLDFILSDLVFRYFPDSIEIVWIGVFVFKNGSLAVSRVESLNNYSLDEKTIDTISSNIKKVRLTNIDFPSEYYKWGEMIKIEKEKTKSNKG